MSKRVSLFLAMSLALTACSQAPEPSAPEVVSGANTDLAESTRIAPGDEEAIDSAVQDYTRRFIAEQPGLATSLGLSEETFGPFKQRLPDYSPEGMSRLRESMHKAAQALSALSDQDLSVDLQRHLDINAVIARYYAGDPEFSAGYVDTWGGHLPYVVNQISGPLIELPNILQDQHTISSARDAQNYLERLRALATVAHQVREKLLSDAQDGVILPKPLFPNTLGYLDAFSQPAAGEHSLVTSLAEKLADVEGIDQDQADAYMGDAQAILAEQVYPAIEEVRVTLQSLQEQAPENVGIWAQPNGESYYQHAIRYLGDSELSADDIHQLGLREVVRITARMDEILKANDYTEGSVGERMQQLNQEERFLYADSVEGREALLEFLRGEISTIEERAPDYFSTLPPQDVEVRRIPVAAEAGAAGGYYVVPSLDGSRPGVFFINLKDMNAVPEFGMKTLTYHEAVPGHHFQLALNQLQTDIGLMRQNAPFNGYVEGWALYSELLAYEMGMYEDDPFGDLGRLQAEVYRAARLVVDTGLHAKRWSRQQAIEYFAEATGTAMSDVVPAIDRYIAWPGQALGYKLGMVKLLELRQQARDALGEDFDVKAFHDVVLLPGARPLSIVERDIKAWIERT